MDVDALTRRVPTPRVMNARLSDIARSHTLRCDARQWEKRFERLDEYLAAMECFELGDVLPSKMVKGKQPVYADTVDAEGTPVINTMSIRDLGIDVGACRIAIEIDHGPEALRRPRLNDVLVTVDGGTSIGKPVLFDLEDEYGIDSHVGILRPVGITPDLLVFLLASPLGQLQFQRAESGASGQTSVADDDIRRFRFPVMEAETALRAVQSVRQAREEAADLRAQATASEEAGWSKFLDSLAGAAG